MQNTSPASRTSFRRLRPGILAGFITGLLIGPCGLMTGLFISWGIRDSFLITYGATLLLGLCGGSLLGPFGGLLGAIIAIKTGNEKRMVAFAIAAALLILIPLIILVS